MPLAQARWACVAVGPGVSAGTSVGSRRFWSRLGLPLVSVGDSEGWGWAGTGWREGSVSVLGPWWPRFHVHPVLGFGRGRHHLNSWIICFLCCKMRAGLPPLFASGLVSAVMFLEVPALERRSGITWRCNLPILRMG